MRKIIIGGLLTLLGACATMPAENLRLTEARSIARLRAEKQIDESIASLSQSGVLGDVDCAQETGADARQCNAFMSTFATRMETLKAEERKIAMADAADEIEALAAAITNLSDADLSALRSNLNTPLGLDSYKPVSAEGELTIKQPDDALSNSLAASDRQAGDRMQVVVMEILAKLMSDPSLR